MAKFTAQPEDATSIERYLREKAGLGHLRARHRADLVTIESGPAAGPAPHARLRRVGAQTWRLEMATHTGRWETTPFEATRDELVSMLVENFGWVLAPLE